jgi:hypothetical protein
MGMRNSTSSAVTELTGDILLDDVPATSAECLSLHTLVFETERFVWIDDIQADLLPDLMVDCIGARGLCIMVCTVVEPSEPVNCSHYLGRGNVQWRYDVALSFAGEQRSHVLEIAECLKKADLHS